MAHEGSQFIMYVPSYQCSNLRVIEWKGFYSLEHKIESLMSLLLEKLLFLKSVLVLTYRMFYSVNKLPVCTYSICKCYPDLCLRCP